MPGPYSADAVEARHGSPSVRKDSRLSYEQSLEMAMLVARMMEPGDSG